MMDYLHERLDAPDGGEGHELSPTERRLTATLARLYRATPSPDLDARMLAVLRAGAAPGGCQTPPRPRRLPGLSGRLVPLAATLALVAGGSLGYLRLSGPAPVSAQSVLSRAAAAMRLGPGEAAHLSYQVTISSPAQAVSVAGDKGQGVSPGGPDNGKGLLSSHADVWVQADAAGLPARSSQTLSDPAGPPKGLLARYLQLGQQVYGYIGGSNWIVIPGSHDQHPGWMIPNAALQGAGLAQELGALAQRSPRQVQLLPERTLDGTAVEALQVDGWADAPAMRTTFYFDSGSYLLRGFDAASSDPSYPTPSWQVRLLSYATVPAAAVPADVFTLAAPANAQIDPPRFDPAWFVPTFQATCHSTLTTTQLEQIVLAKRQTLLAACQATAPAVAADDLVAALLAPYRATLAGAAAAVSITPAQVDAALATQRQWLAILVTTPGGGSSLS